MTYRGPDEVENIINTRDRHCRIGKVTRKAKPSKLFHMETDADALKRYRELHKWPVAPKELWKQPSPFYSPLDDIMIGGNRKCSCRPGQACGNVACPHMLTVSNATFPAAFA